MITSGKSSEGEQADHDQVSPAEPEAREGMCGQVAASIAPNAPAIASFNPHR